MARDDLSLREARLVSLAAQGFDRPRPRGRVDARHLRRVVDRLGLLQLDFVNVLVPSHYLVPFSRLGAYDRSRLDELVHGRRELTEQWAREACIVPVDTWPLLRHRMDDGDRRVRALRAFADRHPGYLDAVREHVRARGPLRAAEVPEPEGARELRDSWWGWTNPKVAVEALFASGELAIAERRSRDAARSYDLAERVLPERVLRREVPREEAQRELLLRAARAHGVGTARDLADYWRMPVREARLRLTELAGSGELREVRVEGWREAAYRHPDARLPRTVFARALLSPFDPVVWHRDRVQRLFGFDYVLEIWVPRAQRRWGYYVLPFLLDDRLVARVDLKADRAERRLAVLGAWAEAGVERDEAAAALAEELRGLAGWLGLDAVAVARRGDLARALRAAVSA